MNPHNPYQAPRAPVADVRRPSGTIALADRGTRLAGAFLDGIIGFVLMLPAFFLGVGGAFSGDQPNFSELGGALAYLGLAALGLLAANLYFLFQEGQSLGKKILGTRIVDLSGARISGWKIVGLRILVPGLLGLIPFLGAFFGLADSLFIFRDDRRCLHDHIAGTIVVRA